MFTRNASGWLMVIFPLVGLMIGLGSGKFPDISLSTRLMAGNIRNE